MVEFDLQRYDRWLAARVLSCSQIRDAHEICPDGDPCEVHVKAKHRAAAFAEALAKLEEIVNEAERSSSA